MSNLKRNDLLYPELSYQIIGVLFEVSNELGGKYQEHYYQRAIASVLEKSGIVFKEQVSVKLNLNNETIARGLIDFVIDDKVAVEIKRGERFLKQNLDQLYSYLRLSGLKLGILVNFTSRGLHFKRVINLNS